MNNVLIIDADIENCKKIKYSLQNADTDVYYTQSITEALGMIRAKAYTLIIMDVLLSQSGGLEILREIRQMDEMPILALSEQASATERVIALNCGADDVLNKPYDLEECLARAQSLMRRYTKQNQIDERGYALVSHEEILLDTAKRIVSVAGESITLTRKEYEILLYMLTHRKQVLTFEQIYNAVWNEVFLGDNSVIFYHMAQLRKKLGGNWIESVYGVGYRMRDPETA